MASLGDIFNKVRKKILDSTTIDDRVSQAFNTAKSNFQGNVKALTSPQTRSTYIQGVMATPVKMPFASNVNNFVKRTTPLFKNPVKTIAQTPVSGPAVTALEKVLNSAPARFTSNALDERVEAPVKVITRLPRAISTFFNQGNSDQEQTNARNMSDQLMAMSRGETKNGNLEKARQLAEEADRLSQESANEQINRGRDILKLQGELGTAGVRTFLTAMAGKAPIKDRLLGDVIGTAMGAANAKMSGEDVIEGAGKGLGSSAKYVGLNRVSSKLLPFLDEIKYLPARAGAKGAQNLLEDYTYAKLGEGRDLTVPEAVTSFGFGAGFEGGSTLLKKMGIGEELGKTVVGKDGYVWNSNGQLYNPETGQFVPEKSIESLAARSAQKKYIRMVGNEGMLEDQIGKPRLKQTGPNSWVDTRYTKKFDSTIETPKMEVVPDKNVIITDPVQVKKIQGRINKGELALKQRGWGNNRFSPEELEMVRQGVNADRAKIGKPPIKPKSPLGRLPANSPEIKKDIVTLTQEFEQSQMEAEQAQIIRAMFNTDQLKDINKLKFLGAKALANGGDIETLRKKYPQLVEKVVSHIREAEPNIVEDTEAFQYALDLPTKAATLAEKPAELKQLQESLSPLQQLREQGVNVQTGEGGKAVVANAEPNKKTLDKIFQAKQLADEKAAKADYSEWQKAVYNQEAADGGLSKRINDLTKSIKENTSSPLASGPEEIKDISNVSSGFRDVYRNFKEAYGKNFQQAKALILDPFDKAKGAMVDEQEKWVNELDNKIIKDLGIKKGSAESEAVQLFGEGKMNQIELTQRFGPEKAQKIMKADEWFRGAYDKLLGDVNRVRAMIYPNNPAKQIPRRADYYRHFVEITNHPTMQGLKNIFDTPSNIASTLAGVSDFTKPKTKWLSFAQKRKGELTQIDAVAGFLDYIKAAVYAKHIDPHSATFRNLAEDLGKMSDDLPPEQQPNNFIEFLHDFANDLDGKTNPIDRAAQKYIPGGRKAFRVINWLNNRVKANVILGNLSSSVAQFFNIPQGIADAGLVNSTKGAGQSLASIFKENKVMNESNFIKERYSGNLYDRFDKGIINDGRKFAAWITGIGDEIGTKFIWNSEYQKALSEGVQDAVKFADDRTRMMVAGRGIGEVPLAQKAKITQLVAPFQLEVANLWHVMGEFVGEKKFGKLATLFIASYLMNQGAKAVRGSDVTFDPINAMVDAFNTYQEEDDKKIGGLKAGGRLVGEVLSNFPGGQSVAAMYPEYGMTVGDTKLPTRKDLFGEGDPTRFGGGPLFAEGIKDPLFKLLPSYGGQQIKRTIEGLKTVGQGYAESKTGKVQTPVEQNATNFIKGAMFGKNSLPEMQTFFNEKREPLGDKQTENFKQMGKSYYDTVITNRKEDAEITKAKTKLKESGDGVAKVGKKYLILQDNGEVKTIDISKPIEKPKLTGNTEYDKKVKSRYKSDITSRQNDIIDLAEAGQITQQEAVKLYNELESIKKAVSGGGGLTKTELKHIFSLQKESLKELDEILKVKPAPKQIATHVKQLDTILQSRSPQNNGLRKIQDILAKSSRKISKA